MNDEEMFKTINKARHDSRTDTYDTIIKIIYQDFAACDERRALLCAIDCIRRLTGGDIGEYGDDGHFFQTANEDSEIYWMVLKLEDDVKKIFEKRDYGKIFDEEKDYERLYKEGKLEE